ncbi:transcription antitermination factor NusB [Ileibacterium valens]|nr:transcription antitermination factor NusB [Ileibacterium valens]
MSEVKEVQTITPEQIEKGILDLPPYLFDSVKDRIDQLPMPIVEALALKSPISKEKMIEYKIPFNRHEMRKLALEAIYQHLLLDKDIRKAIYDVMNQSNEIDGYLYSISVGTVENEDYFKDLLSGKLRKDWSFDRISLLEQAILMMGCQEILVNETPKAVVIDEAVNLAKEYCDDNAPKLINGILDTL